MKKLVVSLSVAAAATFAQAEITTLYVDARNYDETLLDYRDSVAAGFDGSTEEKAFGTIQMAVDAIPSGAADAFNEIIVLPGVYDKGSTNAYVNGANFGCCRVWNDQKKFIRMHSRDGAATTHIVGAFDPDTVGTDQRGNGDKAVRGICNYYGYGFRVEGFTIRNCAAMIGDGTEHNYSEGSAVMTVASDGPTYVADCVISNCVARDGVVYRGAFFRTLFCDNTVVKSSLVRNANLYCSIVTRNWSTSVNVLASDCQIVNSTLVNNSAGWITYGGYVYNSIVSLSSGTANELYALSGNAGNVSTANGGIHQTIAPLLGDFRVLQGSAAETAGDPQYLSADGFFRRETAWFPTDWIGKDFNGATIVAMDGKIMAGALQQSVAPAGGRLAFTGSWLGGTRRITVEGTDGLYPGVYAYPTVAPVQWRASVKLASGEELYGFTYADSAGRDSGDGRYLFPQRDGTFVLTPPTETSAWIERGAELASETIWADPTADVSAQDGSFEHPYRKLCDVGTAIEGKTYVLVKLKKGTYAEGSINHWGLDNRFSIRGGGTTCRFIGVDGAAETVIRGAEDKSGGDATALGCGPNAIRLFTSQSGVAKVQMQGITFADGFTTTAGSGDNAGHAGLCYPNAVIAFSDCVVTNCGGGHAMADAAVFERCKVVDCHPRHLVVYNGGKKRPAVGTYFENVSSCLSYNLFDDVSLYACTVVDTKGEGGRYGFSSSGTSFASVLSGGSDLKFASGAGNVVWNYELKTATSGYVEADPQWTGLGSPSVFGRSPAVTAGAAPAADNAGADFCCYGGSDYDGNKLAVVDGKFAAGARQTFLESGVYVSAPKGGVAVAGGQLGYNGLEDGPIVLSIAAAERPCFGYTVNGVTNLFDETASRTITKADAAEGLAVEALYANIWRVSPDGNDGALGYTANTAFRTLQFAMSKATSGDVVCAGPGVYREGGDFEPSYSPSVKSRVIVKSGVTLLAAEGPENTVIEGESDTETPDSDAGEPADPAKWGCGPKAVRCVYLNADAKVAGFTLRGGRTRGVIAGSIGYDRNHSGGAILGCNRLACVAENCVITNCGAYRGGVMRYGTLVKCRVYDCFGLHDVAGLSEGYIRGCLMNGLYGVQPANWDVNAISDTTFLNTRTLDGTGVSVPYTFNGDYSNGAANVLVNGRIWYQGQGIERNVYASGIANSSQAPAEHPGLEIVSAEEMALDEDGRPIAGRSVLTEKADASRDVAGFDYTTDVSGFQRVMNGARDVGALEADWRGVYCQDIASARRAEVTDATPAVFESAGKTVLIPAGAALSLTVKAGATAPYLFRFVVPNGGSLTVTNGADETVYEAGSHELTLEPGEIDRSLVFASAVGTTELLKGRSLAGGMLILR